MLSPLGAAGVSYPAVGVHRGLEDCLAAALGGGGPTAAQPMVSIADIVAAQAAAGGGSQPASAAAGAAVHGGHDLSAFASAYTNFLTVSAEGEALAAQSSDENVPPSTQPSDGGERPAAVAASSSSGGAASTGPAMPGPRGGLQAAMAAARARLMQMGPRHPPRGRG